MTIIVITILLPLFIVKGCGIGIEEAPYIEKPKEGKDLIIKVYLKDEDRVAEMGLEEYIKGVVAAEMPTDFGIEALKAQAVAARTYAYGRMTKRYAAANNPHPDAHVCTDHTHCQAWVDRKTAMKKWGILNAFRNWNRVSRAVEETEGIVIVYEGELINALYHANSGGRTENAEDVWEGVSAPYLRSVASNGEEEGPGYRTVTEIKTGDFIETLRDHYPDIRVASGDLLSGIRINDYTEGGRVKTISIGNVTLKGTEFRKIFSLKSANFIIERAGENTLKITTLGNGHGVGMSQCGADYMARNGGSFEEIIKYYYKGVKLVKINLTEDRGQEARGKGNSFSHRFVYIVPNSGNNNIWRWEM